MAFAELLRDLVSSCINLAKQLMVTIYLSLVFSILAS